MDTDGGSPYSPTLSPYPATPSDPASLTRGSSSLNITGDSGRGSNLTIGNFDLDGLLMKLPAVLQGELQPLQENLRLQFHLLASHLDTAEDNLRELEGLVREVGTYAVRHSLSLPLVPGLAPTCGICAQVGHSHRVCPVKPVGHVSSRCRLETHLRPK